MKRKYQSPHYQNLYAIFEELSELETPVRDLDHALAILEDGVADFIDLVKLIIKEEGVS